MQKTIWLVTHAETVIKNASGEWCPDPIMSEEACQKIGALKPILNEKLGGAEPLEVHCGVGRRQWQVACALGFDNPRKVFFSSLWGDASTLGVKDESGEKWILLSHLLIPYNQYLSAKHASGKVVHGVIEALPHNSVICSGRPVLLRLGMELDKCHNGALYAFNVLSNGLDIVLIQQGKILPS